jgi:hypothetical protein
MNRWLTISWWMSAGFRLQILRAGVGAVVGVAFTLALCTLGESSREALVEQLLGGGEQIRAIQRPGLALGGIDVTSMISKGRLFDEEDVAQLEGIDGVAQVWPEAWSRYSVYTTAKFPGMKMKPRGDAVLLGVPYEAVARDLPGYRENDPDSARDMWQWEPGEPVPVAIPRSVIAAYNSGFQPAHADDNWPKIDDSFARNVSMKFCPGDKYYKKGERCELEQEGEIIAVTPYAGELAAIVPIEVVHWLGEQLGDVEQPRAYSSVLLTLQTGADPDEVEKAIKDRGWDTEEIGSAARNLALALRAIDLGVAVAGSIIVLAALTLLAQVYGVLLRERRNDIRVLRALGSSRSSLGLALISEVGLASLVAAVSGVVIGVSVALLASSTVSGYLEGVLGTAVEISPAPPGWLIWGMLIGTPLVAMLAVLRPIMQALQAR